MATGDLIVRNRTDMTVRIDGGGTAGRAIVTGSDGAAEEAAFAPASRLEVAVNVATIAALKAVDVTGMTTGTLRYVRGYSADGDGGEGVFRYDAGSSATDNGGTIIQPTAGSGRWLRQYADDVQAPWFGGFTSAAVTAALAAAEIVCLGGGTYSWSATVSIPAYKKVYGNGVTISTISGAATFSLGEQSVLENVTFYHNNKSSDVISILGSGATVTRCKFLFDHGSTGSAIKIETYAARAVIKDNTFFNFSTKSGTFVFGATATQCTITNNNARGADKTIFLYAGGYDNIVSGNSISYCTTGVTLLSGRNAAPSAADSAFYNNVISNNSVVDASEEGISLDGSSAVDTSPEHPTYPIVTYSSSANQGSYWRRITLTTTGQTAGWATGYHAIFISGTARGFIVQIEDSGSGFIDVHRASGEFWNSAVNGDKILIAAPLWRNVINNNTVRECQTGGIVLWGSCWYNIISGNSVEANLSGATTWRGINVTSIANPSASGQDKWRNYSGYNSVIGNIVHKRGTGGVESGWTRAIDVFHWKVSAADVSDSDLCPGTVISGNMIIGGHIYAELANDIVIDGNMLSNATSCVRITDCTNALIGQNSSNNTFVTPTLSGTTTGLRYSSLLQGNGTPEGSITAPIGSLYLRLNGGANTSLYIKESGTGNTGWVAK